MNRGHLNFTHSAPPRCTAPVRMALALAICFAGCNREPGQRDEVQVTRQTLGAPQRVLSLGGAGIPVPRPRPQFTIPMAAGTLVMGATVPEGLEPWWVASDGGMRLLRDTWYGPALNVTGRPVAMDGVAYWPGATEAQGRRVWRTDGRPEGTLPALDAGAPCSLGLSGHELTVTSTGLAVVAHNTQAGVSICRLTSQGASELLFSSKLAPAPLNLPKIVADGGPWWFIAETSTNGRELYRSDGTASGTVMVKDIAPGTGDGAAAGGIALLGPVAFFPGNDGVSGAELWRSDGTDAGTFRVVDLFPGAASSSPRQLMTLDPTHVAFLGDLPSSTTAVFVSDGTTSGTVDLTSSLAGSSKSLLGVAGGRLVFAFDSTADGIEPFALEPDGGVQRLGDLRAGPGDSTPQALATVGGRLLFVASDAPGQTALWSTDGTPTGTLKLPVATPSTSAGGWAQLIGDRVVLGAGFASTSAPWVTDGTVQGTLRLAGFSGVALPPSGFTSNGAHATFIVSFLGDAGLDERVAITDGTPSGTRLLTSAELHAASNIIDLVTWNGRLLLDGDEFTVVHGLPGAVQHFSRAGYGGLAAGLGSSTVFRIPFGNALVEAYRLEQDGGLGLTSTALPSGTIGVDRAVVNERYVFGQQSGSAYELVAFTPDAGFESLDLDPRSGVSSMPERLVTTGSRLFYVAASDAGRELLVSDGTRAGTQVFADLTPGGGSTTFGQLAALEGVLFAHVRSAPFTGRLLRTRADGGPGLEEVFKPDGGSFALTTLQAEEGGLYLLEAPGQRASIWRLAHADSAPSLLGVSPPGWLSSNSAPMRSWGSQAVVAGEISSGMLTEAAERLWLAPGDGGLFTPIVGPTFNADRLGLSSTLGTSGGLFLPLGAPELGLEPYVVAPGAQQSTLLMDLNPGVRSSTPRLPIVLGQTLYFVADDPAGDALYAVDLFGQPGGGSGSGGGGGSAGGGSGVGGGGGSAGGGSGSGAAPSGCGCQGASGPLPVSALVGLMLCRRRRQAGP